MNVSAGGLAAFLVPALLVAGAALARETPLPPSPGVSHAGTPTVASPDPQGLATPRPAPRTTPQPTPQPTAQPTPQPTPQPKATPDPAPGIHPGVVQPRPRPGGEGRNDGGPADIQSRQPLQSPSPSPSQR